MGRAKNPPYSIAIAALCGIGAVACSTKSCAHDSSSGAAPVVDAAAPVTDAQVTEVVDAAVITNADGWPALAGFDSSVSDTCHFFVAPSATANHFPKPIAWEACDPALTAVAPQIVCRQIIGKTSPVEGALFDRPKKSVTLVLEEKIGTDSMTVVAEADGPVHQAIVGPAVSPCALDSASVSSTNVVVRVTKVVPGKQPIAFGAFGGPINGSLKAIRTGTENDKSPMLYAVGKSLLVGYRWNQQVGRQPFESVSWLDGGVVEPIKIQSEQSGQILALQFHDDDLFYVVGDEAFGRIERFVPGKGTANFVFLGADGNDYATNIGTDGTTMVWNEAHENMKLGDSPWNKVDVMTAGYTSDPGSIVKQKVIAEPTLLRSSPFVVGCQFAAHEIAEPGGNGIHIVRTWDARSWTLRNSKSQKWIWKAPVAMTCDEMFVNVELASHVTKLVRIRLDSLGAGDSAVTPDD